jgi:hypothetical protein
MITLDQIDDLGSRLEEADKSYGYQLDLTNELDALAGDFTETDILKIVLWKLNRYVGVGEELRASINNLRTEYSLDKAERVLRSLLACKGVNLPMASAILRFSVPHHLQIIDQRVYRILTGQLLKVPRSEEEKVGMYFNYLHPFTA